MSGDGLVDLHCHLVPGVDDGPPDLEAALKTVRSLARQGVERAVATPHVDASRIRERQTHGKELLEGIDAAWERLLAAWAGADAGPAGDVAAAGPADASGPAGVAGPGDEGLALKLERGVEVRLDAPVPDLTDPRLRLAGSRAVLVEFAFHGLPLHGDRQIVSVAREGWIPVLAHAGRYRGVESQPERFEEWRDAGAVLQVNAGSPLGRHGKAARKAARELFRRGWADLVASDYHGRGEPFVAECLRWIRDAAGGGEAADEAVRLLFETNPSRLLEGQRPLPVPPLEGGAGGLGGRLRSGVRRLFGG